MTDASTDLADALRKLTDAYALMRELENALRDLRPTNSAHDLGCGGCGPLHPEKRECSTVQRRKKIDAVLKMLKERQV